MNEEGDGIDVVCEMRVAVSLLDTTRGGGVDGTALGAGERTAAPLGADGGALGVSVGSAQAAEELDAWRRAEQQRWLVSLEAKKTELLRALETLWRERQVAHEAAYVRRQRESEAMASDMQALIVRLHLREKQLGVREAQFAERERTARERDAHRGEQMRRAEAALPPRRRGPTTDDYAEMKRTVKLEMQLAEKNRHLARLERDLETERAGKASSKRSTRSSSSWAHPRPQSERSSMMGNSQLLQRWRHLSGRAGQPAHFY